MTQVNPVSRQYELSSTDEVRRSLRCSKPDCACQQPGGNVHCPVDSHSDSSPSCSVNPGSAGVVIHCHVGCPQEAVLEAVKQKGLRITKASASAKNETLFNYTDEQGKLLYQVVRTELPGHEKKISQRRPNGSSGWINNLQGVSRVLYKLPDVLTAEQIYVVEGEKCAEALNKALQREGLHPTVVATTNSGGAGKWPTHFSKYLKGKAVVVLPDNDEPGRDHAQLVCAATKAHAQSVKLLELEGLLAKGDVADWLQKGGTASELQALAQAAPEWITKQKPDHSTLLDVPQLNADGVPLDGAPDGKAAGEVADGTVPHRTVIGSSSNQPGYKGLPSIQINNQQARDIYDASIQAIAKANQNPTLFVRAGSLAKVSCDPHGPASVVSLSSSMVKSHLAYVADWVTINSQGQQRNALPPRDVADAVLHWGQNHGGQWPGVPYLKGIVTAPVVAADGTLCCNPGYNSATGLYYHADPPLQLGDTTPTPEAVASAKQLLLDDLLIDFPFVDDSSRAHALALLLLPFVRQLINGPTPLHDIDAPMAGTGKGLLVMACTMPFLSREVSVMTAPQGDDEWRKRITSTVYGAPPHILIDNARVLTSKDLAAALTATIWEDRKLGVSENISIPVRSIWITTTNNAELSYEMTRRTIWIRLNAKAEQPYLRDGFRHPDLRTWATRHRAELVTAALTLIRAWLAAGSPAYVGPNKIPGSYEQWGRVIGGILDVIGVPGFLDNSKNLYDSSDTGSGAWRGFVKQWYQQHGSKPVGVKKLLPLAEELLADEFAGSKGHNSTSIQLGKRLTEYHDRVFGSYQLVRVGQRQGAIQYRVILVDEPTEPQSPEPQNSEPPLGEAHPAAGGPSCEVGEGGGSPDGGSDPEGGSPEHGQGTGSQSSGGCPAQGLTQGALSLDAGTWSATGYDHSHDSHDPFFVDYYQGRYEPEAHPDADVFTDE